MFAVNNGVKNIGRDSSCVRNKPLQKAAARVQGIGERGRGAIPNVLPETSGDWKIITFNCTQGESNHHQWFKFGG